MEDSHFHATAWNNGSYHSTGTGYGLRVSTRAREQFFDPNWTKATLYLSGDEAPVEIDVTPSFWKGCSELRHSRIGRWLIGNGYANWERGNPPKFQVTPTKE